jgi:hypothetical protein
MNKNLIILLTIGALFVFVLGGGMGIFYQVQKDALQLEKGKIAEKSLKVISSKLTQAVVIYGEVSNIDQEKKTFTLSAQGDSIDITMKKDSLAYLLSNNSNGVPVRTQIDFKDIKNKDMVRSFLEFLPDGQIASFLVMIIPSGVTE